MKLSTVTSMMLILGGCTAVTVVATLRRWSPSIVVSVGVAVGLRMLVAIVALGHTPIDVAANFHSVTRFVAQGKDPIVAALPYQWNFLPTMPYLWSALLHLHLPWETTDKIPVIAAEGLNTVLVATPRAVEATAARVAVRGEPARVVGRRLARPDRSHRVVVRLARAGVHPAARGGGGEPLVGLGIAVKTWPVIFVLAVMRGDAPGPLAGTPRRDGRAPARLLRDVPPVLPRPTER